MTAVLAAHAQTLARPGWVGSGMNLEPWWRAAVFYRIAPEGFQDSDGDSLGDLAGIAQRLDYLQSLGVDAVVLEMPFADSGFDDLLREGSRRHIRILVALPSSDGNAVVPTARQWLSRGTAGIWLRVAPGETGEHVVGLVHALRTLTDSFPGQRVLVEDTTADPALWPASGAQLTARPIPTDAVSRGDVVALRLALAQVQTVPPGSAPLLLLTPGKDGGKETHNPDPGKVLATVLLSSRGAVALDYGQEIGLPSLPADTTRIMRWTPGNVTIPQKTAEAPEPAKPVTPPREDVYGAFVPYVPPSRKVEKPLSPDLNSLPGFTTGALPPDSSLGLPGINVAEEDADPNSLLSFYRKLSQLHHDDPSIRSGVSYTLDHDAQSMLVWALRAPPGAQIASTTIAACNLTGNRIVVPLRGDVARLKLRGGELRVLVTTVRANAYVLQNTDKVSLEPWSLLIAETYH